MRIITYLIFIISLTALLLNTTKATQVEKLNLHDTFWYLDFGDGWKFEQYFQDDFYISSNGFIARKHQYVISGDSICIDYYPRKKQNDFFKIIRVLKDTIEIRSPYAMKNDGNSLLIRSKEDAFLSTLKNMQKSGLRPLLNGTKFYSRIDEITSNE